MTTNPSRENLRGAWWIVAILGLLYILSFLDRVVLALLVGPLKADLGISDLGLGLLFGPAFAVFYAIVGLPIARLADRSNRKRLIVAGVLLWALATIASGFAASFAVLVALRMGLAIGEAALTPAAFSMIGDLFAPSRRRSAASVYSAMGMAGASGAYILGAAVIHLVSAQHLLSGLASWRLVLVLVGLPTFALGVAFAALVREPPRQGGAPAEAGLRNLFAYLNGRRFYAGLFLGAGLIQAIGYAYSAWGVEVLRRQFHLDAQHAGLAFGLAGLAAGSGGTLAFPFLLRALERAGWRGALTSTSSIGLLAGTGFAVAAPLQSSPVAFLALQGCASFFLVGATNIVIVALQNLAPPAMRATLVSALLMTITLLGLGIGPTATAALSTALDPGGQALGKALAIFAPLVAGPALALLMWSRRGERASV